MLSILLTTRVMRSNSSGVTLDVAGVRRTRIKAGAAKDRPPTGVAVGAALRWCGEAACACWDWVLLADATLPLLEKRWWPSPPSVPPSVGVEAPEYILSREGGVG